MPVGLFKKIPSPLGLLVEAQKHISMTYEFMSCYISYMIYKFTCEISLYLPMPMPYVYIILGYPTSARWRRGRREARMEVTITINNQQYQHHRAEVGLGQPRII